MPDQVWDSSLDRYVQDLVLEICVVLDKFGIEQVNAGAIMRLVGVPNDVAIKHDDMVLDIKQELQASNRLRQKLKKESLPPGTTLH
jgi:hypothetical protein